MLVGDNRGGDIGGCGEGIGGASQQRQEREMEEACVRAAGDEFHECPAVRVEALRFLCRFVSLSLVCTTRKAVIFVVVALIVVVMVSEHFSGLYSGHVTSKDSVFIHKSRRYAYSGTAANCRESLCLGHALKKKRNRGTKNNVTSAISTTIGLACDIIIPEWQSGPTVQGHTALYMGCHWFALCTRS